MTHLRHCTVLCCQLACSGSEVSGIHSSGWRNPNFWRGCYTGTLARWRVQRLCLFFSQIVGKTTAVIKPFVCILIINSSTVHLVEFEWNSCNARPSRMLGFSSRWGNGWGISPLFIASLSSSFSMGSRTWYDALSTPVKVSHTRLEDEKWESSSSRVVSWYHLLNSHGTWINACVFRRLCESFWLHILLIKHQVNIVPGECQRIIVIVFTAVLSRLSCPYVHSVNTTRWWWWHGHQAGRQKENIKKNGQKNQAQTPWSHPEWHDHPREIDAWVCRCRHYFRSILTLELTHDQLILLTTMLISHKHHMEWFFS